MKEQPSRDIFCHLAVRDLGFEFNPQFTDDNAACMIVSDKAYVMRLAEPFFQSVTQDVDASGAAHA